MERSDPVVSEPSSPSPLAPVTSAKVRSQFRYNWDILAVLLLLLASMPVAWLAPRSLVVVANPGLVDDSWHLDQIFKASRGIWIGRDVVFTHGPIFQWLSSVPGRSMGVSMGGSYATWDTLPLWCAVLFGFLALRLLLPEQPAWKRFVLLLLLCIFWDPSLRTTFAVFAFALLLRGWYAVAEAKAKEYIFGGAAAALCATAFLIAADQGVYALAALAIAFLGVAIESRGLVHVGARFLRAWAAIVLCAAVLVVIINCILGKCLDFHFWRDAFAQVAVYRWATCYPMSSTGAVRLFGTLISCAVIFALRFVIRGRDGVGVVQRTGYLIASFAFGLVVMQSALVRADDVHILLSCFVMIFLAGAVMFSFTRPTLSSAAVLIAALASALGGEAAFRPSNLTELAAAWMKPLTACPSAFAEFDRGCFAPAFAEMLQSSAGYLQQHSKADEYIVVFPYQTLFGLASRRDVAGGLMQPYTASGTTLSRIEIEGLERTPAAAGLYLPDPDLGRWSDSAIAYWRNLGLSLPVDGVDNFTRTPEVWFWLFKHYRGDQQLAPGVFGLQRDHTRSSRIVMQPQSTGLVPQTLPVTERSSSFDLGTVNWPVQADFLRLRLNIHYGVLWKLRKPELMQLEITLANGSRSVRWFVVQPNVMSDVWFYPWSPTDLVRYFDPDESHWRSVPRSPVVRLRLLATPVDWLSRTPAKIEVASADAVRVTMSLPLQ